MHFGIGVIEEGKLKFDTLHFDIGVIEEGKLKFDTLHFGIGVIEEGKLKSGHQGHFRVIRLRIKGAYSVSHVTCHP